ncbi:MAG: hypothetical protein BZY75_02960 [SAR202 cluster bacterium Io17-Chloro-G7]|nr:MAG: hypothetical protein BZY75_02960 [SAR202 cluster bacterium Io17-Chloro-G7]
MALQRSVLHAAGPAVGTDFAGIDFIERHGWELPGVYTDVASEYESATTAAAVHDASYMGRLKATGEDALDLLNRLSTNELVGLEPGQGAPTILTTDRGRILDAIIVVNTGEHVLLLTSPGMQDAVISFLDKYTIMEDLIVEDVTATTSMLAVWGPQSAGRLAEVASVNLDGLPLYHSVSAELGASPVRLISCSLSDLPGFYIISSADHASKLWQSLTGSGVTPMGESTYETARINQGIPVQGSEMGEEFNPLEAGLIGSIDFAKGCYIGQEVIARLDTYKKVQKYLVKLAFDNAGNVSPGTILSYEGKPVGKVTSVARDPSTGQTIGLGYVRTAQALAGTRLELAEPESASAEIVSLPQMFGPEKGL